MDNYILDGEGNPVLETDIVKWSIWMEEARNTYKRRVGMTQVNGYTVYTSFLGSDYNWAGGTPILYETMATNPQGNWTDDQERYYTREEALAGHQRWVTEIGQGVRPCE